MLQVKSVLITDKIDSDCAEILSNNGVQVLVDTQMDGRQLLDEIQHHDAIVVRSSTKVTKELIEMGSRLKLIGRAGTGVDNIDLKAADEHGIVVMNTPAGNSRSAAELTCTMILCLARHVPQAHQSFKQGNWARSVYMGTEVFDKTLAIIGLGRIGKEVAFRMQSFGMKVIGHDPSVSKQEAVRHGIELLDLDGIWSRADYITVHVPLIPATRRLINKNTLDKCKKGVYLVNVARGGIIDEDDLRDAIKSGQCSGVALDVFSQEPPTDRNLVDLPQVICTPHLGASTQEAQKRVAREIAENIVSLNAGVALNGALNGSVLAAVLDPSNAEWVKVAEFLAIIVGTLTKKSAIDKAPTKLVATLPKNVHGLDRAISAGVVVGLFKATAEDGKHVNLVNAEERGKKAGIKVTVRSDVCPVLKVDSCSVSASGCSTPVGILLTNVNGLSLTLLVHSGTVLGLTSDDSSVPDGLETNVLQKTAPTVQGRAALFGPLNEIDINANYTPWTLVGIQ